MKNMLLIIMICLFPCFLSAAVDTTKALTDSVPNPYSDTNLDAGEAGGIDASDNSINQPLTLQDNWLYLVLAGIIIAIVSSAITRALSAEKTKRSSPIHPDQSEPITTTSSKEPKTNLAEIRKLKQDLKTLQALNSEQQTAYGLLEKKWSTHRNFDTEYFSESFKKLVVPMNEAMEKGSRKEIIENMLRLAIQFSSLTRYKISKKQPYDEANIHYLLNQQVSNTGVIGEINGTTPIDKIPKNIKTIVDLLKEENASGLDDAILAGYKIRNL